MSAQVQANSSPPGDPPSTLPTDPIRIHDEESEIPDSSQMELVEMPVEAPKLRRNKDKPINYKECSNTDSETLDATHEPSAESEDAAEDIPRKITIKTRSRTKKETENSERVTPTAVRRQNTTKRTHDDHQSETPRPTKRGRPTAANSETKKFEKDALGLVERFNFKSREFETTRSENEGLKREIKLVKSKLEQEQTTRKETESALKQEINQLEGECKKWKIRLVSALDALKGNSGNYIKVSDSEIKENWMTLCYNIRNLVAQCLTENPANQNTALESLVMSHRFLSTHDMSTLRACILRRTIWRNATLPILSGRQSVWQGELGATLTEFLSTKNNNHIKDAKYLQIISQIKSRAVPELSDEDHLNIEAMEVLIGKVTKQFSPFIPDSKVERFMKDIKILITNAADIHSIMMKSKAIFLTQWIGDDDGKKLVPFDRTKMMPFQYDKRVEASNSFVKFVEAPALVKIGTADGEKFDTSMVLCESWVTLKDDNDDIDEDGGDTGEDGDDTGEDGDDIVEHGDDIVEDGHGDKGDNE